MSKTAGFNDQVFVTGETASVDRSLFDLSYSNTFTLNEGLLAPFYIQDCMPGDTHTLTNDIQAYQMPLEVPITNKITLYTQYFFCPYRILWKHFKPFIQGGRYGDYEPETPKFKATKVVDLKINNFEGHNTEQDFLNIDYTDLTSSMYGNRDFTLKTTLGKHTPIDYMGFPLPEINLKVSGIGTQSTSKIAEFNIPQSHNYDNTTEDGRSYLISAMPLMAFQRIYRDYYLNQHINKDWFGFDDIDDWTLQDGPQIAIQFTNQAGNTKTINLNEPRWVDWSKDYFTTALTSPFLGSQPRMNIESNLNFENTFGATQENPTGAVLFTQGGGKAGARNLTSSSFTADQLAGFTNSIKTSFEKGKANGIITLENIRLLSALTMQLENQAKIDGNYEEFLRVTYGISPKKNELDMPIYIGGTTQPIIVQSVIQTSESTQNSSLGQMAGKGVTSNNGYVGKFTATEPGIIMGIMHILPETIYATQGIDKEWTRETRYDYPMPAFEGLGMEGILEKEIYSLTKINSYGPQIPSGTQDELFGYQERNDSYRHRKNIITTNMRYSNQIYWNAWTQKRKFETNPTLTNDFLRTGKTKTQSILLNPEGYTAEGQLNEIFTNIFKTQEPNYLSVNKFESNIEEYMYTAPTEPHFIIKAWNGDRAVRPLPKKASNNYL